MPESEPCTTPLPKQIWGHSVGPPHQSIPLLQGQPIDNSPTSADINFGCRPCHKRGAEKKTKQTSSYPNMESVWPITDPNQLISNRPAQGPPTPNRRTDGQTKPHSSAGFETSGFFLSIIIKSLSSRRDRPSRPMLIRRPSSAPPNSRQETHKERSMPTWDSFDRRTARSTARIL